MSASEENCTGAGAVLGLVLIVRGAGIRCAASQGIEALVARAILLGIVILAPGGLLLLPFLAAHEWNRRKSPTQQMRTKGNIILAPG